MCTGIERTDKKVPGKERAGTAKNEVLRDLHQGVHLSEFVALYTKAHSPSVPGDNGTNK